MNMKIRTKLILLIVFITVISNFYISIYIIKTLRNYEYEFEYKTLRNMTSLTHDIMNDKYYSTLSEQIYKVYDTKEDLKKNATILRSSVLGTNVAEIENTPNYQVILKNSVRNLSSIGVSFLIYDNHKLKGTDEALSLIKAKDSNNNELVNLVDFPTPYEGRSHILYLNDKKYLVYICTSNTQKEQKLVLIKDITSLIDQSEELFYSEMNDIKRSITKIEGINENYIFISDEDGNILNTSTNDTSFIKNFMKSHELHHDSTEANCELDENYYACYDFFKPLKLHITVIKTQNKISEFTNNMISEMYPFVLAFLFFAATISAIIISKITSSIKDIADRAKTIADADLSNPNVLKELSKYKSDSSYEINKVNEAISTMTSSLNKNISEMLATNTIKNRIETELNVAHDIQMGMLPSAENTPTSKTLDISTYLQPAKEVGGDFFDVFRVNDNSIAITIGDVSDKGVPAAMFMSICVTTLRQLLKSQCNVSTTLSCLNNVLSERNPNMMFVTLFVAIIDERTGKFSYGNAGHCQPCLITEKHTVSELQGLSGPAIGVMEGIPYKEFEGQLDNNEYMYIYTDGVSEAQNSDKKFFEVQKILETLKDDSFSNSQSVLDKILNEVIAFRGNAPQSDDITMMSIKYTHMYQEDMNLANILEGRDKPILTEK